jgi:pimeloyl-ACP methyl ester carboxylesterase
MKGVIHFAHGNGFPSPCYGQMLNELSGQFKITHIDMIGHNPTFPVTENWHYLVDEIIQSISSQSNEPVIAVGHSLGGVLSAIAAIEKPEYFKAVILLDSPLLGRFKSSMVKFAKALGIIDRVTPALRTKGRRVYWQSKQELIRYLKCRSLFKTFDDECLNDYIDHGLKKSNDGYFLRFDRHIEYLIYRTIPHTMPQYQGKLTTPCALIYGQNSNIITGNDRRNMRRNYDVKLFPVKGTHLYPLEYPHLAAQKVITAIHAILDK